MGRRLGTLDGIVCAVVSVTQALLLPVFLWVYVTATAPDLKAVWEKCVAPHGQRWRIRMMQRMALWRVAPGEISGVSGKTGFKSTGFTPEVLEPPRTQCPMEHSPVWLALYQVSVNQMSVNRLAVDYSLNFLESLTLRGPGAKHPRGSWRTQSCLSPAVTV